MIRTALLLLAILLTASPARAQTPQTVFEMRIIPIFKSPNPSSCVQCHLAGVDLKNYILPSAKETFLSLRDQGLIDLDDIEKSKILGLIQRGKDDKSAGAKILQETRTLEYLAFVAWLKSSAADPTLRNAPKIKPEEQAKPKPVEVIRHARKDRLAESFASNVWSMRFRCMNCHTEGTPQNDKIRKENGDRVAWFKKAGPEATMEYILASKLIDFKDPEKSLLLTKPLGTVKHGGGIKFAPGDQGYKAMRAWIDDVVAIKAGKYQTAADLPPMGTDPKHFGSENWLKLKDTPEAWADKLLQVDLYAWDATAGAWEKSPIATSDRLVFGKGKLWQHTLTLLAPAGSKRSQTWASGKPTLPPGKYLVKIFVDQGEKVKKDWRTTLGKDEYAGRIEFESRWKEGYDSMTVISAGAGLK